MRRLRSPFVLVATTVLVAGCTEGAAGDAGASNTSDSGSDGAVSCADLDFSAPCAEEGRVCQDPCTAGPYYDMACRGGHWQSKPNGYCNPPGWPYSDSGSVEPDTRPAETAAADATLDGALDSSPDAPASDAGDVD